MSDPQDQLLTEHQVAELTGLSTTTIRRYERAEQFPPRLKIGPRMVRWQRSRVIEWINKQVNQAGGN